MTALLSALRMVRGMGDQFDLSILDSGTPGTVAVLARMDFDTAMLTVPIKSLTTLMKFRDLLADTASGRALKRPTPTELRDFGRDLFKLVVQGDIKTVYDKAGANTHLRVQILSNYPAVQAIPWEYLQDPKALPGPNAFRSIVRLVPTIGVNPPAPRPISQGIRLLFAYAEPPDLPGVEWVHIKATIEQEFANWVKDKQFSIDVVESATRQSLMLAFQQSTQAYDVLHLVCHGKVLANGTGVVVLQAIKGGAPDDVPAATLATLLQNRQLRLVVLSSCNTATGNFAEEFAVVARTLVECGIPAVVANQFEIRSEKAALFAEGFYPELIRTGDIDKATTSGRVSLSVGTPTINNVASIDWGIPTLYRHVGGARTF